MDSICARFGVPRQRVDVLVRSAAPNDHERCLLLFAGESTFLGRLRSWIPRALRYTQVLVVQSAQRNRVQNLWLLLLGLTLGQPWRVRLLRGGRIVPLISAFRGSASWILRTSLRSPPLVPLAFAAYLISGAVALMSTLQREWKSFASHVLLIFAGPGSSAKLQSLLASRTSSFIRLSNRARNGNGLTKMSSTAALVGWSAVSLLETVAAVYPAALASRLMSSRHAETRRRILLVSHESQLNGAPRSLLAMIQHTDRHEFEPILLAPSEGLLTVEARSAGVEVFLLPISQLLSQDPPNIAAQLPRFLISLPSLLTLLVNQRIDLVHTNVLVTPDAAIAAYALRVPHLWHFREFLRPGRWARIQTLLPRWLSARLICNSNHSEQVLARLGVPGRRLTAVHNGIDLEVFQSAKGDAFRRELGVKATEVLVGCAGQVTPDKGQDVFVEAAIASSRSCPEATFVLVGNLGNRPFVRQLRKRIEAHKLSDRILFAGYRTDIAEVMAALDVHVAPSRWDEPFGRVALEAMAAGAVSVVADTGGLPEIVEDRLSGRVFERENTEQLARLLTELLDDPDERASMRRAGLQRSQLFSVDRYMERIQQIWREPRERRTRVTSSFARAATQVVRSRFPGRLGAHSLAPLIYPPLICLTIPLWSAALLAFSISLPVAMLLGTWRRGRHRCPHVCVFAYQTIRNASTRYRIAKVFDRISSSHVQVRIFYPSSNRLADLCYDALFYGHLPFLRDLYYYHVVFYRRLLSILRSYSYDCAVIQYELLREGPMWMEWLLTRTHLCTIYDYDDSLFAFPRYAKNLPRILPHFDHVVVGNDYLARYTLDFNPNVTVSPTCPDHEAFELDRSRPAQDGDPSVVLGWIGNPANLAYLRVLREPILKLATRYQLELVIVCAGPWEPEWFGIEDLPLIRREWSLATEAASILDMDIGVMPVDDDDIGRGKCGFKALQFMSAGVPIVISPVGVNAELVQPGVTGFLARTSAEWYEHLEQLIADPELRERMGTAGSDYVRRLYNLDAQAQRWRELVESLVRMPPD